MLTPWVGWAIDTRGVRPVALLAVALAGGALIGLAGVTGQLELGLWFALLRFAGPECMVGCTLPPPSTDSRCPPHTHHPHTHTPTHTSPTPG